MPSSIEVASEPVEINCHNCSGACCRGPITMDLSSQELEFMRRPGVILKTVVEPDTIYREQARYPYDYIVDAAKETIRFLLDPKDPYKPLPAGFGRYMLIGKCGYLKEDEDGWEHCSAYEQRPQVCKDFVKGSLSCQEVRQFAGVDEQSPEVQARIKQLLRQKTVMGVSSIPNRKKTTPKKSKRYTPPNSKRGTKK